MNERRKSVSSEFIVLVLSKLEERMMKNWEGLFQEHILERGYNYYRSGAVTDVSSNAKGYHAIVEGTEEYGVDIELHGGEFGELYCTCPMR